MSRKDAAMDGYFTILQRQIGLALACGALATAFMIAPALSRETPNACPGCGKVHQQARASLPAEMWAL